MDACFCSVAIFFFSGFLLAAGATSCASCVYSIMDALLVTERWSSYDFLAPSITLSFSFLFNYIRLALDQ